MASILQANNITIRFGGLTAVNDVSLNYSGGEILSIIGPNGAGKTTLFNLLTGFLIPNEGKITFMSEDITEVAPYKRVKLGIARTFQNIRLFDNMSVLENILIAHPECNGEGLFQSAFRVGSMRNRRGRVVKECEKILESIGLLEDHELLATSLPYGKQRLLEIARALATDPSLVLLDEPGAGMNPIEKEELTRVIRYMSNDLKKHIILIDHDMKFVMNISDRIIVLDHGKKIAEGTSTEIRNNQRVINAYLGDDDSESEG